MKLNAGQRAPLFALPDQDGKTRALADYAGGWVLIYFYPKDDTPGCTVEACGFRDNLPRFKKSKLTVLGISADSVASHKKFAAKFGLPFALLSDESKQIIKKYGAWGKKTFMGRTFDGIFRTSFLIDPRGIIRKIYEKVKPPEHPVEVAHDILKFSRTPE